MSDRVLVLDAAMGTRLITSGLSLDRDDPALWNLSHPSKVAAIHRRDRSAGADALTSNTFGANRNWLDRYGQARHVGENNRRAVHLAREAAGDDGIVLGDLGPTAVGRPGAVREQAEFLVDAGVDALLFETFRFEPACSAVSEVVGWTPVPVLVSLFEWPESIGDAAKQLADAGADAIGMNCQPGIAFAIDFAERVRGATELPLIVRPSAVDPLHPEIEASAYAAGVDRLVSLGVRLIGGCCGTTEVLVAALRTACYAREHGA
jgi:methionine synthase I (cobalamin-dependent)